MRRVRNLTYTLLGMYKDLFADEQDDLYDLPSLICALLLSGLCFFLVYIIWLCCNENFNDPKPTNTERLTMKPVYAQEIEKGIFILQNEDGDYFKILKEYDKNCHCGTYGTMPCTRPEMIQPVLSRAGNEPGIGATRAFVHAQGLSPSAPPGIPYPQTNVVHYQDRGYPQDTIEYMAYTSPPPYCVH